MTNMLENEVVIFPSKAFSHQSSISHSAFITLVYEEIKQIYKCAFTRFDDARGLHCITICSETG